MGVGGGALILQDGVDGGGGGVLTLHGEVDGGVGGAVFILYAKVGDAGELTQHAACIMRSTHSME